MGKRETLRWLKLIQRVPCTSNQKPELLDDILQETEGLIKIFVTSIKTAEKKPRLGVVEYLVFGICFSFDVGRSMFDVHLSKQLITYGQFGRDDRYTVSCVNA